MFSHQTSQSRVRVSIAPIWPTLPHFFFSDHSSAERKTLLASIDAVLIGEVISYDCNDDGCYAGLL